MDTTQVSTAVISKEDLEAKQVASQLLGLNPTVTANLAVINSAQPVTQQPTGGIPFSFVDRLNLQKADAAKGLTDGPALVKALQAAAPDTAMRYLENPDTISAQVDRIFDEIKGQAEKTFNTLGNKVDTSEIRHQLTQVIMRMKSHSNPEVLEKARAVANNIGFKLNLGISLWRDAASQLYLDAQSTVALFHKMEGGLMEKASLLGEAAVVNTVMEKLWEMTEGRILSQGAAFELVISACDKKIAEFAAAGDKDVEATQMGYVRQEVSQIHQAMISGFYICEDNRVKASLAAFTFRILKTDIKVLFSIGIPAWMGAVVTQILRQVAQDVAEIDATFKRRLNEFMQKSATDTAATTKFVIQVANEPLLATATVVAMGNALIDTLGAVVTGFETASDARKTNSAAVEDMLNAIATKRKEIAAAATK